MKKIAFLFGGRSAEHEVSLSSAATLLPRLLQTKNEICPIFIDKDGALYRLDAPLALSDGTDFRQHLSPITLSYLGASLSFEGCDGSSFTPTLFFSALHGTYGEDGAWQGLFELSEIPYIGCGVLSSALCMHKATAKELIFAHGIPTAEWLTVRDALLSTILAIERAIPYPVFVKPVDQGSSIGVACAHDRASLQSAIKEALAQSTEALVEEYVRAKEISVAVLERRGNLTLSPPGEIISRGVFDYAKKYGRENTLLCPANVTEEEAARIAKIAEDAFRILRCRHMARVDLFLTEDGRILFNEINTIPGLTAHSLYPQLLAEIGEDLFSLFDDEALS